MLKDEPGNFFFRKRVFLSGGIVLPGETELCMVYSLITCISTIVFPHSPPIKYHNNKLKYNRNIMNYHHIIKKNYHNIMNYYHNIMAEAVAQSVKAFTPQAEGCMLESQS